MISLSGVTKAYVGQSRVLDQINLELGRGDFLYVVGGTGAGKSSLLRMLATEETPTAGQIGLFGYDLAKIPQATLRAIRRSIGYVPQNVRLIPDLSVYDNIALSAMLAGPVGRKNTATQTRARIYELMERLGIAAKANHIASSLSGGEAQRVAVARALARGPELIIADEPTGSQDKDFTWSLMDLLVKMNVAGATVVVATHDREIVRRVRRRCAVLKAGQIQLEEPLCIY
jgi:cell division transport system ATP-binding protein